MKFKIIGIGNRNLLKNKETLKYNYKNSGHISVILVLFLAGNNCIFLTLQLEKRSLRFRLIL